MLMIVGIGFIVFAILGFSSSLNSFYGVTPDGNYSKIYDSINESVSEGYGIAYDVQSSVEGSERSGVIGDITSFSSGIYRALKLPFDMVKIFIEIISTMLKVLPFPSWVGVGLIVALIITITYLILSAIMRHNV